MPRVVVTMRDGEVRDVNDPGGGSVMEAIRDAGIDEIVALCGGCLSCATCHVYVDPAFATELPPMSSDEDELLDSSSSRRPGSRLSCQLPLDDRTDGIKVTIAPEE